MYYLRFLTLPRALVFAATTCVISGLPAASDPTDWGASKESKSNDAGVVLPKNWKVMKYDDTIPKCSKWLGYWGGGSWNGKRPGALIVLAVFPKSKDKCKAEVIHAWGDNPAGQLSPGFVQKTGTIKIKKGQLSFRSARGAPIVYKMNGEKIDGVMGRDDYFIKLIKEAK